MLGRLRVSAPDTRRGRGRSAQQLGAHSRAHRALSARASCASATRIRYEVAANWKVICENYNECYHCGGVHPELCAVVPAFRERGGANSTGRAAFRIAPAPIPSPPRAPRAAAPSRRSTRTSACATRASCCIPNLFMSLACDHAAVFILQPRSADAHRHHLSFPVRAVRDARSPTSIPATAVEFWDLVNRQDWAICEAVQQGMQRARARARLLRADGGFQSRHPPLRPGADRRRGRCDVRRPAAHAAATSRLPARLRVRWKIFLFLFGFGFIAYVQQRQPHRRQLPHDAAIWASARCRSAGSRPRSWWATRLMQFPGGRARPAPRRALDVCRDRADRLRLPAW